MPRFKTFQRYEDGSFYLQFLFVMLGVLERTPFIGFGGEVCRIVFIPLEMSVQHSYTWGETLVIPGIPGLLIALGWVCVGQIIWVFQGRFLWPHILMGLFLWWIAEVFVPADSRVEV